MNKQGGLHVLGNILGLMIVCAVLLFVFLDQLILHDLPCPLCLLQRISYIAIGLCMLMNLCLGFRASHYGLMVLATLLGMAVSVRQVYIHLLPGNPPGYGIAFFGQFLYTWSAISFILIMVLIAVALIFDRGLNSSYKIQHSGLKILIALFLFLILANGISTFMICGPYICPDSPINYYFST